MPELSFEDHSEEVQEILGRIPKWVVRWGITLLFTLTSVILIGSYFIPYPESINIPVSIEALNPASPIVAKQGSNKVKEWFIKNQQHVNKGELIAMWETEDDYSHILELENSLAKKNVKSTRLNPDAVKIPSLYREIRNYVKAFDKLFIVQQSTNFLRETNRLNNQIEQKAEYLSVLQKQLQVKEREFKFLEEKFKEDSIYYHGGGNKMEKRDYQGALLLFLQQKSAYFQYQASVIDLKNSLNDLKNEFELFKAQRAKSIMIEKVNLEESMFLLKMKIKEWKAENLILSPINGRLDRTQFWSENQQISSGEILGVIIPDDHLGIICKGTVNAQSIGRLEEGQRVLIKLDGYNAQENASVEGVVSSISQIPYNDKYQVSIDLTNKLTTMNGLKIPFIQGLVGVAEILIDDSRLISKLTNLN